MQNRFAEDTVLVILPDRRVNGLHADAVLSGLDGLDLSLTVPDLFGSRDREAPAILGMV